jgi:hypothetical protein
VATINRCIHEFGRASEPVAEDLIAEVCTAERKSATGAAA